MLSRRNDINFDKIIVWVLVFKLNDGLEAAGAPKLSSKYHKLWFYSSSTPLWAIILFFVCSIMGNVSHSYTFAF